MNGPATGSEAMAGPQVRAFPGDDMVEALEDLRAALSPRLAPGLTMARDNPGRTPPAWSVRDPSGRSLLTVGVIDRTYFWTWDEGDSNHYAKDRGLMVTVITSELVRFGHMSASPLPS